MEKINISKIRDTLSTSNVINSDIWEPLVPLDMEEYYDSISKTISTINCSDSISIRDKLQKAAKVFAYRNIEDPGFGLFAGRLECCALYCSSGKNLAETMKYTDDQLHEDYIKIIEKYSIDFIDETRDFRHDYFAMVTLEKSYLLRRIDKNSNQITVETPQQMWCRVALWLWYPDISRVKKTYDDLSQGNYIHASPTLFNSGLKYPMLTSCFLLRIDDSMESITRGWHDCAMISKNGGGIGIDVSRIRHSAIRGTGMSSGLVGCLKVYGEVMNYSNQCLAPDTVVFTPKGGVKISDIKKGDKVFTSDGTLKFVRNVIPSNSGLNRKMVRIITESGRGCVATHDHRIWILRDDGTLGWCEAGDISDTDKVVYSIPQITSHIMRDINYSEEELLFYGVVIANSRMNNGDLYINCGTDEDLLKLCQRHLISTSAIKEVIITKPNSIEVDLLCIDITLEDIYDEEVYSSLLKMKEKDILKFLEGIVRPTIVLNKHLKTLCFEVHENLIDDIFYLFLRLGILVSIICINDTVCVISVPPDPRIRWLNVEWHPLPQICNNYLYDKIYSVEILSSSGHDSLVYDLEIDTDVEDEQNFLTEIGIVHNSGRRKGSATVFCPPWHKDIFGFIEMKSPNGPEDIRARNLFYALWISDLFMRRVKEGGKWSLFCPTKVSNLDELYGDDFEELYLHYEKNGFADRVIDAQELWKVIIQSQQETGGPFMLYKDAINSKNNQKNLGTIKSSNLCVSGDTMVLTNKGHIAIKSLNNQKVTVWNGQEWSDVTVRKTGINKDLVRVNLSNGVYIDCTPEHKFYIRSELANIMCQAQNLRPNDKLVSWTLPCDLEDPDEKENFPYPYTHGFFCGFQALNLKGNSIVYIDKTDENTEIVRNFDCGKICENDTSFIITLPKNILPQFKVPLKSSKDTCLKWLEGYFADAVIIDEKIEFVSEDRQFFLNLRLLLQTFGIEVNIQSMQNMYKITISFDDLCQFSSKYVTVDSIEEGPRGVDTFCFSEPKNHTGMFNGIMTGQCVEIVEYSSDDETSNCNLASVGLDTCVVNGRKYDYNKLERLVRDLTRNLNQVIDRNYYPPTVPQVKRSNLRHRPIGIGVHGLADTFALLGLCWDSDEASTLNRRIFEVMYFAFMDESCNIAQEKGITYESYFGSPASQGIFQFDMWGLKKEDLFLPADKWEALRIRLRTTGGLYNSLGIALMPTASSAQINGKNESFEMFTSNLYSRSVLSGQFMIVNKHLVRDLKEIGAWNQSIRDHLLESGGSMKECLNPFENAGESNYTEFERCRKRYTIVWEMSQKLMIDMSTARAPFVCQTQSLNCFMKDPTYQKLTSFHFYGWSKGLKTGMYYLRSTAAAKAVNYAYESKKKVCNEDVCESCSA